MQLLGLCFGTHQGAQNSDVAAQGLAARHAHTHSLDYQASEKEVQVPVRHKGQGEALVQSSIGQRSYRRQCYH